MADYPECPKCNDIYGTDIEHIKAPKILDCGDSICKECLGNILTNTEEEFFLCPQCKNKIKNKHNVDEYTPNKIVITMVNEKFNIPMEKISMEEEDKPIPYNVIALGDSEVGKTSIFQRLSVNKFSENFVPTEGSDKSVYFLKYKNKKYALNLRDSPGQEQYRAITKSYLRKVDGVLFVFDVSKKESFENLEYWYNFYKEENEKVIALLIGNKCDCDHAVSEEEAENFAKDHNLKYFETSAKLDKKVKKAIAYLLEEMIKAKTNAAQINYCQIDNYSTMSRNHRKKFCC